MITTLSTRAQALLAAADAALVEVPPVKVYVSHNAPAWDLCAEDQLSVYVINGRHTTKGRQCQSLQVVDFHVQIVRCVPGVDNDGSGPTAAALTSSAVALLDDLQTLDRVLAESLSTIFGGCADAVLGSQQPLGPLGYVGGWDLTLTLSITD